MRLLSFSNSISKYSYELSHALLLVSASPFSEENRNRPNITNSHSFSCNIVFYIVLIVSQLTRLLQLFSQAYLNIARFSLYSVEYKKKTWQTIDTINRAKISASIYSIASVSVYTTRHKKILCLLYTTNHIDRQSILKKTKRLL